MIDIQSNEALMDSMSLAQETGTEDQFIRLLLYLHEWHGKDKTVVRIRSDASTTGGLIYHKNLDEWGVHS